MSSPRPTGAAEPARSNAGVHRSGADVARLAAGSATLIISALSVTTGEVSRNEILIFRFFNELPEVLFPAFWTVMQLGALPAIPLFAIAALIARRPRMSLDLAVCGLTAYVLAKLVKEWVGRARPAALLEDVVLRGTYPGGLGFVSGHVADAAALAAAASPWLGRRGRIASWSLVVLVSLARVYVGAHLPLDGIGGAGLGYAIAAAWRLIAGDPRPPTASKRMRTDWRTRRAAS